jgi:hypothetical protein
MNYQVVLHRKANGWFQIWETENGTDHLRHIATVKKAPDAQKIADLLTAADGHTASKACGILNQVFLHGATVTP